MSDTEEFDGDSCVVLPKNYLNSAEAVSEVYEDELAEAVSSFEIGHLSRKRFFSGTLLVITIWAASAAWTVCF